MYTSNHSYRLRVVLAAIAGAFAAPALATGTNVPVVPMNAHMDMSGYAENYLEIGAGYSSDSSYKFGEFNDLESSGGHLNLGMNYLKRDADSGRFYSLFGSNLGLDSRAVEGAIGEQGNYEISARYDELTRNQFDDTTFIHNGLGSTNLTLPGNWPAAGIGQPTAAASVAAIAAAAHPFKISQDRTGYELDMKKILGTAWSASAHYRLEDRGGTKLIGSVVGVNGGNPRAVILPRPTEDRTHRLELEVDYATMANQFRASYEMSLYRPNDTALTWQNPYAQVVLVPASRSWGAGTGYPTYGSLSLDPENSYHQFSFSGAHRFNEKYRLSGLFSWSTMRQDAPFLPYTVNPTLAAAAPALPRSSLDGEINTTLIDLTLAMRPWRKLHLSASYRYDDHDNQTPQASYAYVAGDAKSSGLTATNLPPSEKSHRFKLDGDYPLTMKTKLGAGYEYEWVKRTFEARERTWEHSAHMQVRHMYSDMFSGLLRYDYSNRKGSLYDGSVPNMAEYGAAASWSDIPSMRKRHLADRVRNKVKALGTITPTENTSLQASVDLYRDSYDGKLAAPATYDKLEGLSIADGFTATLDGSVVVREGVTAYAFFTHDRMRQKQFSRSFSAAAGATNAGGGGTSGNTSDWSARLEDRSNTFGLGANYKPTNGPWTLGAEFTHSRSVGETKIATEVGLTAATPVPDMKSTLSSLRLNADYDVKKNTTVRFAYWYEDFNSKSWAFDNATASSSNNVILTGQGSPDYTDHVIGVSVRLKNW